MSGVEPDTRPESVEVSIDGLGAAGDGVGRLPDGRVVFVDGALPGDQVRIATREQRKRVQYADLLEVTKPSRDRIPSRCPVERCGGCALKAYSGEGQARAKRGRVVETLRRIGGIDVEGLLGPLRQVGDGWGYRHRVRLHAGWVRDRWVIGYHARRSQAVVPFEVCPVLAPPLEAATLALGERLADMPQEARLEEIELAYSQRDGRVAARIAAGGSILILRTMEAWIRDTGILGVEVETPDARWRFGNIELRYDHARSDQFDIHFEPGVFAQAHPLANDRLVDAVIQSVRPRSSPTVLELHAGIGNFSLPLARAGAHVVAVERSRRAAILSRRNARRAGLRIHALELTDAEAVASDLEAGGETRALGEFDVLLLDPPRTGAAEVVAAAAERGPPRVVYVSCDPATLARDAKVLGDGGYGITHAEAYDMFPQTPHVEVLAVFERHAGSARADTGP